MFRRPVQLFVMGALVFGFLGLAAQTASAHHLILSANATCDAKNNAVINFTVTSYLQGGAFGGNNALIDVKFNGNVVDSGAFTPANNETFSGSDPAPGGNTSVTVTAVAIDNWDDGFSASSTDPVSVNVNVPNSCLTGRFTGGPNVLLSNGVKVTSGLELDCDRNPSFNFEINWAGNHFHLGTFDSASCAFNGKPNPPAAPINTMMGTGTGDYNGAEGYSIIFTIVDNGEPGVADEMAIEIFPTGAPGSPVLSFTLTPIVSGNLQAHPDQR